MKGLVKMTFPSHLQYLNGSLSKSLRSLKVYFRAVFLKVLESAWFVGFSGKSLQIGKTLALKFHEYSRIFKRPIPASYFKLIQCVEIPWIFKNIQVHKSWKFLEIPSSIFLQVYDLMMSEN